MIAIKMQSGASGVDSRQNVIILQWLCHFGKQQLFDCYHCYFWILEYIRCKSVVQPWSSMVNSSVLLLLSQQETDLPGLIQTILVCNKHACKPALQPPWLFVQRGINWWALPVLQVTHTVQSKLVSRFIAISLSKYKSDWWSVSSLEHLAKSFPLVCQTQTLAFS